MRKVLRSALALLTLGVLALLPARATTYTDASNDIDPGLANGGGTLDILGMEVSHTATDLVFSLTVNGNVASTDWGKFFIGISTGSTASTNTGNGWDRPIQLNSPLGGMDYWVGAWVDSGAGAYLHSYNGASWDGPFSSPDFDIVSGSTSVLTYTLSLSSLGLSLGDTIYFDAYSSGGGSSDSAVDSLANPNVSITSWSHTYTSSTVESGGVGLNAYTLIPEPASAAVLAGMLSLAAIGLRRRPRG